MKSKEILLLVILIVSFIKADAQWEQIGQNLYGDTDEDKAGSSIDLNSDGSILAFGVPGSDDNGEDAGSVRVFQNLDGNWSQIGQNINGVIQDDKLGYSLSLNSDGSILAIGNSFNDGNGTDAGNVRIYQNIDGNWVQIGEDIEGEAAIDGFGWGLSLNSDGTICAVGAPKNIGNGENSGHVRVYKNLEGTWTQIGQDINGVAQGDFFGASVSINSDGSIVAVGAKLNDENGMNAGQVSMFKNIEDNWEQIGQAINGNESGDYFGNSVSLNSDGSVVAIGAPLNDENGLYAGQVRVFENIEDNWVQKGQDINGDEIGEYLGFSVDLNSDGSKVAIGAPLIGGDGESAGRARIYQNLETNWTIIDETIYGDSASDGSGIAVSISSDGSIVAIGAPNSNTNGNNAGSVKVYGNSSVVGIAELSKPGIDIYPNPTNGIIDLEFADKNVIGLFLFDVSGKLIYDYKLSGNNKHFQIDLSDFENGIYMIRIQTINEVLTARIIKE